MENDRTGVPHLFVFIKIIRNPENQVLINIYGWHLVGNGQGWKKSKKVKILKVLRMGLPIVENLSGLCGNMFSLFRRPQLHLGKTKQNVKYCPKNSKLTNLHLA